jgi:DNA-binding transcriptional MerR regulator
MDRASFDLEQLSARVEEELEKLGLLGAQGDGRVTAVPDARTIRYYGTLGLVDRPAIVDREARYGRMHVLQIVAIKALQALGLPLGKIQERLYARSTAELEALVESVPRGARGDVSARTAPAHHPAPVRSVLWREVLIEPGLKLSVEEGWSPRTSGADLEERIRSAMAALIAKEGATDS